jgi:hypothetical protein
MLLQRRQTFLPIAPVHQRVGRPHSNQRLGGRRKQSRLQRKGTSAYRRALAIDHTLQELTAG